MSALPADVIAAWQAALAAEHRSVYGYGLLGPRLTGDDRARAQTDFDAHEDVRDQTSVALAAAGQTPVGPEADYPSLFPVADAAAGRERAVELEQTAASAWRYLFTAAVEAGAGATSVRATAQRYLTASAVRAAQWRMVVDPTHASVPFPGL